MQYDVGDRKIVFESLFGSHNYNLNTGASDKDFKVFVCPNFDDLYYNKRFSTSVVTETFDYDVHDIRQLVHLFWKTNINFIEVLFSVDSTIYGDFCDLCFWMEYNREALARMNLPYFYNACVGMYHEKVKRMRGKGTESTKHLVDTFGFECKEASHAYRVLDCLCRYHDNDFKDFKKAIYYDKDEVEREFIVSLKQGRIEKSVAEFVLEQKLALVTDLKPFFNIEPNYALKQELEDRIKKAVQEAINEH